MGRRMRYLCARENDDGRGVPVVKLNNGVEMPRFGIGTFLQPSDEVCEAVVPHGIESRLPL